MKLILQEDVEKLGTRGQLVEVAEGYARNFLLPRKLGSGSHAGQHEAARENARHICEERSHRAGRRAEARRTAHRRVARALTRKAGENDQLFGSVTSADISEALAAQGYTIEKRKIALADPIKLVGEYEIPIKLHREVSATVKLAVKKEE